MSALICGSFAFDSIMVFQDRFKHHILPDKIHMLNVSFLVPDMRREFGGCAGNIAYNVKLLGDEPLPMGTVGEDFAPYAAWMDKCGISRKYLKTIPGSYTGQAFITTDLDDNQITAFHPGAMNFSHENKVSDAKGVKIGILAPDGRQGMIDHAEQFAEAGIPFIFDPGQGMPMFDQDLLRKFTEQARWVTVNDYEWQLMQEKTGWTAADVLKRVEALIVTRGANGSLIMTRDAKIEIPTAKPRAIKDPTGCGDAYRAGLIHGLLKGFDWETTGRIAALMGAIKIESAGTQNHRFTRAEFEGRYRESFDRSYS
ncbi:MAG: carbohydrate kinase family protein [Gammaproteobacteria bacterium]